MNLIISLSFFLLSPLWLIVWIISRLFGATPYEFVILSVNGDSVAINTNTLYVAFYILPPYEIQIRFTSRMWTIHILFFEARYL